MDTTNDNSGFVPHVVVPTAGSVRVAGAQQRQLNGTYSPNGRHGKHILYSKKTTLNTVYLLWSPEAKGWMFSEDALGGADGETGLALQRKQKPSTDLSGASVPPEVSPFAIGHYCDSPTGTGSGHAWLEFVSPITSPTLTSSKLTVTVLPPPAPAEGYTTPLNAAQAKICRQLYRDTQATATESAESRTISGESTSSTSYMHSRHNWGRSSHSSNSSSSYSSSNSKQHPSRGGSTYKHIYKTGSHGWSAGRGARS